MTNVARADSLWTDAAVKRLKKLWADGLAASLIADDFGPCFTRNAIIGKVHRLGLNGRQVKERKLPTRSPRVRGKSGGGAQRAVQNKIALAADASYEAVPVELREHLPKDQSPYAVTLLERAPDQCLWGLNDPSKFDDFRFCGDTRAKIVSGRELKPSPYCARHSRMAWQLAPVIVPGPPRPPSVSVMEAAP